MEYTFVCEETLLKVLNSSPFEQESIIEENTCKADPFS